MADNPNYLELALNEFNTEFHQWYSYIDLEAGSVYSNIKSNYNDAVIPTEEEVNAKIAKLQVIEDRKVAYGSIADQLDMMYWDNVNGTTTWKDHIAQVKSDNPKPV
jgi:hypothetical protein